MAKTDKTDPFWVRCLRAPDAVVQHDFYCEDNLDRTYKRSVPTGLVPCDAGSKMARCRAWSYEVWVRHYREGAEPRVYFYVPERAHVRGVLRDAVIDYNTHGVTEFEPVGRQHRHSPWGGGGW